MDIAHKSAVILRNGGSTWIIGGTWSARGRLSKRSDWSGTAREEGFEPRQSSNVWLAEEEQAGWFVHQNRPVVALPLAAAVVRRVSATDRPWFGIFRLTGDGWWYVALDATGAVHPRWDIWVPNDDRDRFENDHAAEIASLPPAIVRDTPKSSWNWLLDGVDIKTIPAARPVLSAKYRFRRTLALGGVVVVALVSGQQALEWWHHRQLEQSLARVRSEARAKAEKILAARALANRQKSEIGQRLHDYLARFPKPWMHSPGWRELVLACERDAKMAWQRGYASGWQLASTSCVVGGTSVSVTDAWQKTKLSTLFDAPQGQYSPRGNHLTRVSRSALPARTDFGVRHKADLTRLWLGYAQQWEPVYRIGYRAPVSPYQPPMPPFLGKVRQGVNNMPVLWIDKRVSIRTAINPGRSLFFTHLRGFVPHSMKIIFAPKPEWIFHGVQYEQH